MIMLALVTAALASDGEVEPWSTLPDRYDVSLFKLGTSYAATQACACRYISGLDEEQCRAVIKVSPDLARVRFNDEERLVTARVFGLWRTRARHIGPEEGCQLE